MDRRVLVVTYNFPPRPRMGSIRLRGLAKYLQDFGWETVILTAELLGPTDPHYNIIETPYPGDAMSIWKSKIGLMPNKGFQEQIGVSRSFRESRNSFNGWLVKLVRGLIAYPDEQKFWYPFAVKAGDEILKKEHFDAILSSSGPVTCHLIAKEFKKRFGIPWISDLRDLWTQNSYYPYGPFRRLFEKQLEVKTLSISDALVTVSEPLAKQLQVLHSNKPVFAILNGYDPSEVSSAPLTREFTITYTGQLYQGKRDPTMLFRIISELCTEGLLDRQNVKINFYKDTKYWLEEEVKCYGLEDVVNLHPQVPRDIALEKQRESQILLLLNRNDPSEIGIYTGKLFEYLAAQRPIIAVGGPKGVVSDLLEETGAGTHVTEEKELKHLLIQHYESYKALGYVPYSGRKEYIAKYSHYEMARRFAQTLDFLMETKANN